MQDVHRCRHPIGEVVQARALAVGDREIMHIALAMQPGRRNAAIRSILIRVFGEPEVETGVKIHGVLHLGRKDVEMIDPLRMATAVEIIAAEQMWSLVHRRIKLELKAEGIGELQSAALERLFGKCIDDAVVREERGSLVEIGLAADLEAEAVAGGGARLPQNQRVMLMLLAASKINRTLVGILDMQADRRLVEVAAPLQIGHVEHDMARADDVERRIEDMLRNGHMISQPCNGGASW